MFGPLRNLGNNRLFADGFLLPPHDQRRKVREHSPSNTGESRDRAEFQEVSLGTRRTLARVFKKSDPCPVPGGTR